MRDTLGIGLTSLDISADDPCLGDELSRWLLRDLAGYDIAVINAFLQVSSGSGYVQAEHNGETHALSHAQEVPRVADGLLSFLVFKIGTLCSALFMMFATSSLVSFILAQTQQRMLGFTVDLQHRVRSHLPLLPLVGSHLLESLAFVPLMLGVLFFLFEFFGDQLLAFLITLLVWACELWSIISCRTATSLQVFPRAFGGTIVVFLVYYLTYPFGYKYLALQCASLALASVSFSLWHRYELPALLSGEVSTAMPRVPEVAQVLSLRPYAGTGALSPAAVPSTPVPLPTLPQDLARHTGVSSPQLRSRDGSPLLHALGGSPGRAVGRIRAPPMTPVGSPYRPSVSAGGATELLPSPLLLSSSERPRQFSLEEERIMANQIRQRAASSTDGRDGGDGDADLPPPPPDLRRTRLLNNGSDGGGTFGGEDFTAGS